MKEYDLGKINKSSTFHKTQHHFAQTHTHKTIYINHVLEVVVVVDDCVVVVVTVVVDIVIVVDVPVTDIVVWVVVVDVIVVVVVVVFDVVVRVVVVVATSQSPPSHPNPHVHA